MFGLGSDFRKAAKEPVTRSLKQTENVERRRKPNEITFVMTGTMSIYTKGRVIRPMWLTMAFSVVRAHGNWLYVIVLQSRIFGNTKKTSISMMAYFYPIHGK